MSVEVSWRSQQGKRTEDNRDYCGAGFRSGASLFIVLDGSTSGPKSGEFSKEIANQLIDWFVTTTASITAQIISKELRQIHEDLSRKFPLDSASYVILYIDDEQPALVLHAGDCLLGIYNGKHPIQWQIQPHTLANIIEEMPIDTLAECGTRNRLTRSFRSKEFMPPEEASIDLPHMMVPVRELVTGLVSMR